MDAAFIQQNQIVERYLSGKLPFKGAQDFERYCREHPETVTSLGMADRINAALRLLDASGEPEPWAEKPLPVYQKLPAVAGIAGLALILLLTTLWLASKLGDKDRRIASLTKAVAEQPLLAVQSTRPIVIKPSREGPVARSMITIGGPRAELADFKFDVSWSDFNNFRATIDRVDQGLVAVIGNLYRDSNGHLRLSLNSSALGPGQYTVSMEGLDWRGNAKPQAWASFTIAH